jgi:predicted dehydrogenase
MEDKNINLDNNSGGIGRRDILKGLTTLPVLGLFGLSVWGKASAGNQERETILKELNINASPPPPVGSMSGKPIRLGIIGYGIRGEQLVQAAGFASKRWLAEMKKASEENKEDTRLKDFLAQENLNVVFTGVCDVFDVRAEDAIQAVTTDTNKPKRYRTYQEMIASPDIDGVIIATPDHWHAPMAIEALKAGKHVYVEKPMTHNLAETFALRDAVNNSKAVFQVGHQHRQTLSFHTAQDIIKKNILGHINLVQANTNRNSDNGAWQYDIHEKANPNTIDWKQFLGSAPEIPFNKEHFFRWRKWWAYGSGLTGDLLVHDYDRINCVLKMGIPKYVMALGGIYTHRDGRNVPDVIQVAMEFPEFTSGISQEKGKEKGMSFLYSATLGNQFNRPTILMGHDASMQLDGHTLEVFADIGSTRYKKMIESGLVNPEVPMYSYDPRTNQVDGVTSATAKYFANKGLLYTFRDGKRVDSTHLHIKEWLSGIRNGTKVSCGIKEGFEEAITALMGTISIRSGRRVEWDHQKQQIVDFTVEEADKILLA